MANSIDYLRGNVTSQEEQDFSISGAKFKLFKMDENESIQQICDRSNETGEEKEILQGTRSQ